MSRTEFSKKTKLARFEFAKGCCETCGNRIIGVAEYDHVVPDAIGGLNDVDNCRCVCSRCHRFKTSKLDVPQISKSVRIYEKRAGVRRKGRGFQKAPEGYSSFSRTWKDRND